MSVVIELPPDSGTVYAATGPVRVEMGAETISRPVTAYREAQTQALMDRGTW
ncbi:hypothetical protein ACL02T_34785 [Pseudonocardia sp. RS010]|uniref:hypothetical protein n=1 Tax=Pseudonocardia sp. RS010 TaxID=3385979 RepID=UPI0039A38157